MHVFLAVVGVALIAVGLTDMFHTLLHPSGRGRVSHWVFAQAWRASKATGHRLGSVLGPAAMVVAISVWVAMHAVGWALIYLPHITDGFTYSSGIDPTAYPRMVQALYYSVVVLSTLGFGDVVPVDPWIRIVTPLEALTGLALLTAALTWFTQMYPPLSRRRALALHLKSLADSDYAEDLAAIPSETASRVLDELSAEVGQVRIDFTQYSESYYFQERDADISLPCQLPYAVRMRDASLARPEIGVSRSGRQLAIALEQLGAVLEHNYLHTDETLGGVLAAYAADHAQKTAT
ncbi:potassium channel family protein [Cumulibacter manganitolerans]|uniref:potassium channel family protein n=1 Tax=Cumulibacter manganitolerans TaxID=1884992 RepID=UPI0012956722|nr:potassium channel family protein [Cumulibacter manganitolerans]